MKLNVNVKFEDTGRLTVAGNPLERGFVCDGLGSHDFWFDWEKARRMGTLETNQEPYCQVSYGRLADGRFALVTYCEGDINRELCETEADLRRAVIQAQLFYVQQICPLPAVRSTLDALLAQARASSGLLRANGDLTYSYSLSDAGKARRAADQLLAAMMLKEYGTTPPDGEAVSVIEQAIAAMEAA